jgi:integrase
MKKKPQPDVYFWEFARRYLDEVVDLRKPSTYANYKSILTTLTDEFGHLRMSGVTARGVQVYFTRLAKTLSPVSVRQYWVVLNSLLKYAEENGLVDTFRKPKLPRNARKPQRWWTLEEMRTLINGTVGPMKILVMLLAEAGCRIAEARALQSKHVVGNTLYIQQNFSEGVLTSPKTDSSYRHLTISDDLCYGLSALKVNQPECFIFRSLSGRPFTRIEIRHAFDLVCDRLKLPRKGFHAFRRGNITLCRRTLHIDLEIVSQRVGHLTEDLTLDVYVQNVGGYDEEAVKKIAGALYGGTDDSNLAFAADLHGLPSANEMSRA